MIYNNNNHYLYDNNLYICFIKYNYWTYNVIKKLINYYIIHKKGDSNWIPFFIYYLQLIERTSFCLHFIRWLSICWWWGHHFKSHIFSVQIVHKFVEIDQVHDVGEVLHEFFEINLAVLVQVSCQTSCYNLLLSQLDIGALLETLCVLGEA